MATTAGLHPEQAVTRTTQTAATGTTETAREVTTMTTTTKLKAGGGRFPADRGQDDVLAPAL